METPSRALPPRRAAALESFETCPTRFAEIAGRRGTGAPRYGLKKISSGISVEPLPLWRLVACAFLPFAAGYYLSYLFRTINTLIAGRLASDLGLGAADIGLLTSI